MSTRCSVCYCVFFFQAEDGIRDLTVTGVQTCALPILGERVGRTWEPLVLTGMSPRVVAHGKLLAALSYLGLYLAALAPVGALPFLFGGEIGRASCRERV